MATFGERLREARKAAGLTQAALAQRSGVSQTTVSDIERGRNSSSAEAVALALACGVMAEWLAEGRGPMRAAGGQGDPLIPSDAIPVQMQYIPVVGTTKGGPTTRAWTDGDLPVGEGFGWVSVSSRDKSAYALRVTGSSMAPRYEQGEYVLVEPMRKAVPGDFVVVRLASGECMVKRFSAQRPHELVFDSINANYEKIIVAPSDVDFIHYVACGVSAGSFVQNIQDDGYEGPERRWHDEPVDVERRMGGAQG